jgi:hypothetical protein
MFTEYLLGILGKMLFENRRQLRILKVDVIGTGGRENYGGCYSFKILIYFLLDFLTYGFQRSSYDATAFIIRFIQSVHKRMAGCLTTIIQGSCGAEQ